MVFVSNSRNKAIINLVEINQAGMVPKNCFQYYTLYVQLFSKSTTRPLRRVAELFAKRFLAFQLLTISSKIKVFISGFSSVHQTRP